MSNARLFRPVSVFLLTAAMLIPHSAQAHTEGKPFISVNGSYVTTNPLGGISSAKDLATQVYVVGQPIRFVLDTAIMPVSGQTYGWRWSQDDQQVEAGQSITHTYAKPGSYIISLEFKTPAETDYRSVDTVGVTVVPKAGYNLPTAKIKATQIGKSTVRYEAVTTHDASTNIANIAWRFADGDTAASGSGAIVTHTYRLAKDFRTFPSVTVTDGNGLVAQAIFQLNRHNTQIEAADIPGLPRAVVASTVANTTDWSDWLLWVLLPLGLLAATAATVIFHRRRRS